MATDIFTHYISNQTNLKKNLIALLFGALVTLALPPVYILPLAVIGFSGFLLLIIKASSGNEAFKTGWWFGFGFFTAGLYWISFALLVDIYQFGWLIPFALFGIPAVVAIYTGVVALLTWHVAKYIKGWKLVMVFACIWTIIEILRGWLFTGFPWNLAGYMWTVSDNMLQFASIGGIWGLSLLTVVTFTMPVVVISGQWPVARHNVKIFFPIIISALLLLSVFLWGSYRLAGANSAFVPGVKLRIVQANIPQNLKWQEDLSYMQMQKYFDMTRSRGFEQITHVIWPETAVPFVMHDNSPLLDAIVQSVPKNGAVITGTLRGEYTQSGVLRKLFNSLIVVSDKGELYSSYDKSHLVPFGEYVPLRSILPLEKITAGAMDFSEGEGAKTINVPGFPAIGALICYEAIFPGNVVDKSNRPGVLINVTNDAWYGKTSGPYQHFEMARTRAVEEGIPLIRAANNGISAVVDGYGRVIAKTELAKTTILDADLPTSIAEATTYSRYGYIVIILIIGIMPLISWILTRFDGD